VIGLQARRGRDEQGLPLSVSARVLVDAREMRDALVGAMSTMTVAAVGSRLAAMSSSGTSDAGSMRSAK
jgi:hypothetical protein